MDKQLTPLELRKYPKLVHFGDLTDQASLSFSELWNLLHQSASVGDLCRASSFKAGW